MWYSRKGIWTNGIPRPIARSMRRARRFSALVVIAAVLDAILNKRWAITSNAAGIPTSRPILKRVAIAGQRDTGQQTGEGQEHREYEQMSHHTGAKFCTEEFQTTELINKFKQPRPAQAMYREVPTFQAEAEWDRSIWQKWLSSSKSYPPGASIMEWHKV